MNNSDATQTIGSEVAANDGSAPTGDENLQTADNNLWNWMDLTQLESFHLDNLEFPSPPKQPDDQLQNKASQNILSNNSDTIGSEVAANEGSATIVDSSAALIPPSGDKNLQAADDGLWNWPVDQTPLESFDLEDLDIPTPPKQPEQLLNKASQKKLSHNLDATQTIGSEVAAKDGSVTIVDSSTAMIPPAEDENLQTGDDFWNWIDQTLLESFDLEDLDIPTPHKQPDDQLWNKASQLPQEEIGHDTNSKSPQAQFVKPNALDKLAPELRSLISWQSKNVASKGEARGTPDNDVMIINPPVGGGMSNNRKRKGGEVDFDHNSENNAWFQRRVAGLRASPLFAYRNYQSRTASINDNVMALHALVPGSQKQDMATTLGETADHMMQMQMQDRTLREEIKQLRQAMIMMHQSIQNFRRSPFGTPSNMIGRTQLGGMGFRPPVQPSMNLFDSSNSARMNMPLGLQWNYPAAASRMFVPPVPPGPSQQHRIGRDQIDDTQPTI